MSTISPLMMAATRARVFSSAVLLGARAGNIQLQRAFGAAGLDSVFDVASLTKPLATTLAAMILVDRRELDLAAPVGRYLQQWPHRQVRVWHLLSHSAGFPAHRQFYRDHHTRAAMIRAVMMEPLIFATGSRSLYGDPDFIVLGALVERITGERLDRWLAREVYRPLGLESTFFLPRGQKLPVARSRFVPTGFCDWRRRNLLAEVNDSNAFALRGVAGHAGLFSTAEDLHRLTTALWRSWQLSVGPVSGEVVRRFWQRPSGELAFCLGWDTPSRRASLVGRRMSRQAVGHWAFTGCSLWIDPERAEWIILLTNRVHTDPTKDRLNQLRPAIHDELIGSWRRLGR